MKIKVWEKIKAAELGKQWRQHEMKGRSNKRGCRLHLEAIYPSHESIYFSHWHLYSIIFIYCNICPSHEVFGKGLELKRTRQFHLCFFDNVSDWHIVHNIFEKFYQNHSRLATKLPCYMSEFNAKNPVMRSNIGSH